MMLLDRVISMVIYHLLARIAIFICTSAMEMDQMAQKSTISGVVSCVRICVRGRAKWLLVLQEY